jgi:hypothetical protein
VRSKPIILLALMAAATANAQVLDALGGHLRDIRTRFSEHQVIAGETVRRGDIDRTAKGQDILHNSSGTWTVVRVGKDLYLQSADNFRSSPGPDYHVYISRAPAIKDNDQFDGNQREVGRLLKPNGAAYYKLPTANADEVNSVLIWCKQFKEYIGSADLRKVE